VRVRKGTYGDRTAADAKEADLAHALAPLAPPTALAEAESAGGRVDGAALGPAEL
jgi:hypothetical protein